MKFEQNFDNVEQKFERIWRSKMDKPHKRLGIVEKRKQYS